MLPFKSFLTEVYYTDSYPKQFHEFYKKWKPFKKDHTLYVNFSNHKDNTIDKNFNGKPNHSDPAGLYGYPLHYIIDHPSDIWYGANAKYLRVVQLTASESKILYVQYLTDSKVFTYLSNMFNWRVSQTEEYIKKIKKKLGLKKLNQVFFKLMQLENPEGYLNGNQDAQLYDANEQNRLLRSLGYDVIVDDARNQKSAVVNDREPLQTIFLSRGSFKLIDVYTLTNQDDPFISSSGGNEDVMARKLAALISVHIKDFLQSEKVVSANMGGYAFWTKKGRRILIKFEKPSSYYNNKKVGEKPHRAQKKYDAEQVIVEIYSEKGNYRRKWYEDDKFKDIAIAIGMDWKHLTDDPNFVPEYGSGDYKKKKDEEYYQLRKQSNIKLIKEYETEIKQLSHIYSVDWKDLTDEEWYKACSVATSIQTMTNNGVSYKDALESEFLDRLTDETNIGVLQMKSLLDKIYTDKTVITKKGYKGKEWHDEPFKISIGEAALYIKLRSGWFGDDQWLIFDSVLKWKVGAKDEIF